MRGAVLIGAVAAALATPVSAETYLRLDLSRQSIETQDARSVPLNGATALDPTDYESATRAGLGLGFRPATWLRTELLLEHRFESTASTRFSGIPASLDTSTTAGFVHLWMEPEALSLGPLRPFFGGGVGLAYNRFAGGRLQPAAPLSPFSISENSDVSPAWRLGAGVSLSLGSNLIAELNYAYTDYGTVRTGRDASSAAIFPPGSPATFPIGADMRLRAHDVGVSLRYALGESPDPGAVPAIPSLRGATVRVEAGGSVARDNTLSIPGAGSQVSAELDRSAQYGLGVGWRFTPYLRSELLLGTASKYEQVSANPGQPVGRAEIESQTVMGALWADLLPSQRISPYVGAGIGWARNEHGNLTITDNATNQLFARVPGDSQWELAWMVGAGIGAQIADRLFVDFGWRYIDRGEYRNSPTFLTLGGGAPVNIQSVGELRTHDFMFGLRWEM